jgi:hypothetical protein
MGEGPRSGRDRAAIAPSRAAFALTHSLPRNPAFHLPTRPTRCTPEQTGHFASKCYYR